MTWNQQKVFTSTLYNWERHFDGGVFRLSVSCALEVGRSMWTVEIICFAPDKKINLLKPCFSMSTLSCLQGDLLCICFAHNSIHMVFLCSG